MEVISFCNREIVIDLSAYCTDVVCSLPYPTAAYDDVVDK